MRGIAQPGSAVELDSRTSYLWVLLAGESKDQWRSELQLWRPLLLELLARPSLLQCYQETPLPAAMEAWLIRVQQSVSELPGTHASKWCLMTLKTSRMPARVRWISLLKRQCPPCLVRRPPLLRMQTPSAS